MCIPRLMLLRQQIASYGGMRSPLRYVNMKVLAGTAQMRAVSEWAPQKTFQLYTNCCAEVVRWSGGRRHNTAESQRSCMQSRRRPNKQKLGPAPARLQLLCTAGQIWLTLASYLTAMYLAQHRRRIVIRKQMDRGTNSRLQGSTTC